MQRCAPVLQLQEPFPHPCLVSLEGGLLFFASRDFNRSLFWTKNLLVWNPLTQEHKILYLPSSLIPKDEHFVRQPCVGVVVSAHTWHCKLVVAGDLDIVSKNEIATLLYDSSIDAWKRTSCIPEVGWPGVRFGINFVRRGICYMDDIYFELTSSFWVANSFHEVNEVLKFDVQKETWTKVGESTSYSNSKSYDLHSLTTEGFNFDGALLTAQNNRETRLLTEFKRYGRGCSASIRRELERSKPKVSKLMTTMHGFIRDHNPKETARDHMIEYFGFRQENVFYHVVYVRDVEGKNMPWEDVGVVAPYVEGKEMPWKDVGVVVHELSENSDTLLYLKKSLQSGILYDFFAFSRPSLLL